MFCHATSHKKEIFLYIQVAVCTNLLGLLITVMWLFLCLLSIAIFLCFVIIKWFCPVCIKHLSCTWLGINSIPTCIQLITLHIVLLLTCSISYWLFYLDSWNINTISISISISITKLYCWHCFTDQHWPRLTSPLAIVFTVWRSLQQAIIIILSRHFLLM
jgi:hypothetical protein